MFVRSLLVLLAVIAYVSAHGRVVDPPSRASAWRAGFPTPPNYDDDGLNCGGYYHQHEVNGGKCGICGDPFDAGTPRAHELGGKYGQGIIVANYEPGQLITATIELSAYHRGYWEFKICPDPNVLDQACFDQYPVELEGNGGTHYYPTHSAKYTLNYRLPAGLTCDHCVLQWTYICGNNWGDCRNGTQGLGCGTQEQFGACSDISIGRSAQTLSAVVDTASRDVPSPLLYYLTHGVLEQGLLHLLWKGMIKPYTLTRPPSQYKNQFKKRRKNNKKKTKPHRWKKMPQFR